MQQEKLRLSEAIHDVNITLGENEYDLQDELQYGVEQEIDSLQSILGDEQNALEYLQLQYLQLTGQEYTETDF